MHARRESLRRRALLGTLLALGALLAPAVAAAESTHERPDRQRAESEAAEQTDEGSSAESPWSFGAGARIGGYGFRHVKNDKLSWDDCRMNGVGLFATLDYNRRFFAELSVDYYHATGKTVASGMDRMSMFLLGAVGTRFLRDFFLTPYLQAGIGPEWTKIEVGGRQRTALLAAPFLGVGVEANLGRFKLGTHLRTFAMGVPDHLGHGTGSHPHAGGDVPITYEVAGEMQFFARYAF